MGLACGLICSSETSPTTLPAKMSRRWLDTSTQSHYITTSSTIVQSAVRCCCISLLCWYDAVGSTFSTKSLHIQMKLNWPDNISRYRLTETPAAMFPSCFFFYDYPGGFEVLIRQCWLMPAVHNLSYYKTITWDMVREGEGERERHRRRKERAMKRAEWDNNMPVQTQTRFSQQICSLHRIDPYHRAAVYMDVHIHVCMYMLQR